MRQRSRLCATMRGAEKKIDWSIRFVSFVVRSLSNRPNPSRLSAVSRCQESSSRASAAGQRTKTRSVLPPQRTHTLVVQSFKLLLLVSRPLSFRPSNFKQREERRKRNNNFLTQTTTHQQLHLPRHRPPTGYPDDGRWSVIPSFSRSAHWLAQQTGRKVVCWRRVENDRARFVRRTDLAAPFLVANLDKSGHVGHGEMGRFGEA